MQSTQNTQNYGARLQAARCEWLEIRPNYILGYLYIVQSICVKLLLFTIIFNLAKHL